MNVVPYVDVMLVLLVIFMITVPTLSEGIAVDVPDASAPLDMTRSDPLILSVDASGRFYLNIADEPTAPLDERAVIDSAGAFVSRNADAQAFVRGDERAAHGRVMYGHGLLMLAGAKRIYHVTELPDPERER